jgi:hypothetical protein
MKGSRIRTIGLISLYFAASFAVFRCGGGLNTSDVASGTTLPSWVGTKQLGATGATAMLMTGLAVDSSNNVYIGGLADAPVDGTSPVGTSDMLLIKHDPAGNKQWHRMLGSAGALVQGLGFAIDSLGHAYLAGRTSASLDGNALSGGGATNAFVTQYDSAGARQWTRQLGAGTTTLAQGGVKADPSGNTYVSGQTNGNLDGNTLSGAGSTDFFLAKYSLAGVKQWTRTQGATPAGRVTIAFKTAVDAASGAIYVAGTTTGNLAGNTLSGGSGSGAVDLFISRYDSSGNHLWTKTAGVSSETVSFPSLALDASGNLYISGSTSGALNGVTGPGVATGDTDAFVASYDANGTHRWTRLLGVANNETLAADIAVNGAYVYLSGGSNGGLAGNPASPNTEYFLAQYDQAGTFKWVRQRGEGETTGFAVGIDPSSPDRVFIAGTSEGLLDQATSTARSIFISLYDPDGNLK